jgi:hypothetical protein
MARRVAWSLRISPVPQEAMLSASTLPGDIAHRDGRNTPDYKSA